MAAHRESTGVPARAGRAATFATASVCLALAAHTAGGDGHPPPLAAAVIAVGLLAWVSYGLAGRERSLGEITVGLGAGQFVLHLTFAFATLGHAAHAGTDPGGLEHIAILSPRAATPHHTVMPPDIVTSPEAVGSLTTALLPSTSMLLYHVLAAAVTVVAFRQAEGTLWAAVTLRSWLAGAKVTALARLHDALPATGWVVTPAPRPLPRPVTVCPYAASHTDAMIGRTSRRRGPPSIAWSSSAVTPSPSQSIA